MKFSHWITLLVILSVGVLFISLREIIIQIFAGIILAMSLCTLVEKVEKTLNIPRSFALLISLLLVILVFGVSLIIVVPPFLEELQQLINQLPVAARELIDLALSAIENLSAIFYGNDQNVLWENAISLENFNPLQDGTTLAKGLGDGVVKILGLAGNLGNAIVKGIFILAIGLMISIQPNSYKEITILFVPSFYRRRARKILMLCSESISNWMVGVIISSTCVAILAGIGLSILGVKLVIANALLAGILNIIPNVGPTISTIFPMSVALIDSPWKALAVLLLYIVIQNLESYLITPSVMHQRVKLLPGLTLIAQFIFTIVFGPIGLLLALPMAIIFQVFAREILIHDLLNQWKKEGLKV